MADALFFIGVGGFFVLILFWPNQEWLPRRPRLPGTRTNGFDGRAVPDPDASFSAHGDDPDLR